MKKILEFFLVNSKFNHTLFVLTFLMGIWSYMNMPKEMFPVTEMDIISVSGGYQGSSIETLDKMIVDDLEVEEN